MAAKEPITLMDPSLLLRPEATYNDKPIDAFRDYSVDDADPIKERVRRTYYDMHGQMTVDFVKEKRAKWMKFNHFKATIKEALIKLNDLVDESDPDTDLPNIVHAFQTAERIRQEHPDEDWFHLTGLIHDLGKVMAFYGEPQWCVVGDTFVVGCKWADSIVYGQDSFKDNPDTYNPKYNTKYGMYTPHCGLEKLMLSWGHDDYLYHFLKHNQAKLPPRALNMIRYHSFYPWHAGGDYRHLTNEADEEILRDVLEFKWTYIRISYYQELLDTSLLLRPEPVYNDKPVTAFRDYEVDDSDPIRERVRRTYYDMHTNMTVDFVEGKREKWLKFNHFKSTIRDALIKLNDLVDESDPDTDLPNIVHAFQTAERIRQEHPDEDWFHLTGLIHDLGKVMAFYGEPQWCVVGDTFPVGCKWGQSIVYGDPSFQNNPDTYDSKYNTPNGIYKPNGGIEQLMMSWGHDEYLYSFLIHNKSKLPEEALYMIRYHSFYPWHAGGDYKHLSKDSDQKILDAVNTFNKYDLYTKSAEIPDIDALWPYYEGLIEKYCPGVLEW